MDSYSFEHEGRQYKVIRSTDRAVVFPAGLSETPRNPGLPDPEGAAGAEILRLAEREANVSAALEAALARKVGHLEADRNLISAHLTTAEEERDALKATVEEGREIVAELAAALAVLAGERLEPCDHQKGECSGHLGPQARDAANAALAAWRALQEGNRAARETIQHQEETIRTYRHFQPEPDLLAALKEHQQGAERPADTLRRIIREREQWESAALAEHALAAQIHRGSIEVGRKLAAVESENRLKCLELAEKAGEIRELQEMLAYGARSRHGVNTLLALLDSKEPPARLEAAVAESVGSAFSSAHSYHRVIAQAAWRWLREEAGSPPLSGDDLS